MVRRVSVVFFAFLYVIIECSDWSQDDPMETHTTAFINITYVNPTTGVLTSETAEVAKFGDYHISPVEGVLVHAKSAVNDPSHTGCFPPLVHNTSIGGDAKWIALLKRGHCSFQAKMESAYASKAAGLIVYNDRDSPHLEKMKLKSNVPKEFATIFTYKWKGEQLARLLDNSSTIWVRITVANVYNKPASDANRTSVLFVSVSFVVLMMVSLGWIIFYYVQKCRYIHAKDKLSKRLCVAAKKALQKIPTKHIKSEEKNGEYMEFECCAICIEQFRPPDVVRLLPCRHEFHKQCVDPWLLENRTCPMCKMDILKYFGFKLTGSQESILRADSEEAFPDNVHHLRRDSPPEPTLVETTVVITLDRSDLNNQPSTSVNCAVQAFPNSEMDNVSTVYKSMDTKDQECVKNSSSHGNVMYNSSQN